jgi:hypothetical protein
MGSSPDDLSCVYPDRLRSVPLVASVASLRSRSVDPSAQAGCGAADSSKLVSWSQQTASTTTAKLVGLCSPAGSMSNSNVAISPMLTRLPEKVAGLSAEIHDAVCSELSPSCGCFSPRNT